MLRLLATRSTIRAIATYHYRMRLGARLMIGDRDADRGGHNALPPAAAVHDDARRSDGVLSSRMDIVHFLYGDDRCTANSRCSASSSRCCVRPRDDAARVLGATIARARTRTMRSGVYLFGVLDLLGRPFVGSTPIRKVAQVHLPLHRRRADLHRRRARPARIRRASARIGVAHVHRTPRWQGRSRTASLFPLALSVTRPRRRRHRDPAGGSTR